jgi:hypothetical protein
VGTADGGALGDGDGRGVVGPVAGGVALGARVASLVAGGDDTSGDDDAPE